MVSMLGKGAGNLGLSSSLGQIYRDGKNWYTLFRCHVLLQKKALKICVSKISGSTATCQQVFIFFGLRIASVLF